MPEITQEEFELFQNYKKIGTLEEIGGTLAGFQQIARSHTINEAARISGFKPQVLERLSHGLDISVKNDKAFVKAKDGTETSLSEFADNEWKDFIPSLKAETQQQHQTVAFVPQPAKGIESKPTSLKLARSYITRTYGQTSTVNGGN